jgi:hypothetical protein
MAAAKSLGLFTILLLGKRFLHRIDRTMRKQRPNVRYGTTDFCSAK